MSADSDDAEFVFYGTALQQEEATSRRHEFQKKDVSDAAGSKSLPVWKQVHSSSSNVHCWNWTGTSGTTLIVAIVRKRHCLMAVPLPGAPIIANGAARWVRSCTLAAYWKKADFTGCC